MSTWKTSVINENSLASNAHIFDYDDGIFSDALKVLEDDGPALSARSRLKDSALFHNTDLSLIPPTSEKRIATPRRAQQNHSAATAATSRTKPIIRSAYDEALAKYKDKSQVMKTHNYFQKTEKHNTLSDDGTKRDVVINHDNVCNDTAGKYTMASQTFIVSDSTSKTSDVAINRCEDFSHVTPLSKESVMQDTSNQRPLYTTGASNNFTPSNSPPFPTYSVANCNTPPYSESLYLNAPLCSNRNNNDTRNTFSSSLNTTLPPATDNDFITTIDTPLNVQLDFVDTSLPQSSAKYSKQSNLRGFGVGARVNVVPDGIDACYSSLINSNASVIATYNTPIIVSDNVNKDEHTAAAITVKRRESYTTDIVNGSYNNNNINLLDNARSDVGMTPGSHSGSSSIGASIANNNNNNVSPNDAAFLIAPQRTSSFVLTPESIRGRVYEMAIDQYACRLLQRALDPSGGSNKGDASNNEAVISIIMEEITPHIFVLMVDQYANFLVQKLFDIMPQHIKQQVAIASASSLADVAVTAHGTFSVQKMIESISSREEMLVIRDALIPNAIRLIMDVHGSHVIQKVLQRFGYQDKQFIYDTVIQNCGQIATNKQGCCVIQRCLEFASPAQCHALVEAIMSVVSNIVENPFGNYVLQYILESGGNVETNDRLGKLLLPHIDRLAVNKFSSNVLEKVLRRCNQETKDSYCETLSSDVNRTIRLLTNDFGNYVLQTAMQVGSQRAAEALVATIRPFIGLIWNAPYAKKVEGKLDAITARGQRGVAQEQGGGRSDNGQNNVVKGEEGISVIKNSNNINSAGGGVNTNVTGNAGNSVGIRNHSNNKNSYNYVNYHNTTTINHHNSNSNTHGSSHHSRHNNNKDNKVNNIMDSNITNNYNNGLSFTNFVTGGGDARVPANLFNRQQGHNSDAGSSSCRSGHGISSVDEKGLSGGHASYSRNNCGGRLGQQSRGSHGGNREGAGSGGAQAHINHHMSRNYSATDIGNGGRHHQGEVNNKTGGERASRGNSLNRHLLQQQQQHWQQQGHHQQHRNGDTQMPCYQV